MKAGNSLGGVRPKVAVVGCENYEAEKVTTGIERVFSLLGGVERFISRGEKVLIKPNFIIPRPAEHAVQTAPAVVIALAQIIKDFGAKPIVGLINKLATATIIEPGLGFPWGVICVK